VESQVRPWKVVIPSNNPNNTCICVEALLKAEPQLTPTDIIVVDDGAHTTATAHLPVTWIPGVKPFIFSRNVNLGIKAAQCAVFILNDDTRLLTSGGFTQIAKIADWCPYYGVLSPALTKSWNPELCKGSAPVCHDIKDEWLSFVCAFIPLHVQHLVGLLDERFDGYGMDDVDYCRRVLQAGLRMVVCDCTVLEHMELPSSFRSGEKARYHQEMNDRNKSLFQEKWAGWQEPTRDIIQSLWIGPRLGTIERLCINSFLAHGHPFHLYVYDDVEGVPMGVELHEASLIRPRTDIAKFKNLANFSDWFRYNLIYRRSGWWVDMDTVCLRPFDFPDDIVLGEEGHTKGLVIPASPFKAPLGADFVLWMMRECAKLDWMKMPYCAIGPELMTRAQREFNLPYFPADTFNPIPVREFSKYYQTQPFEFSNTSYATHLHNGTWTTNQLNPDAFYPHDSPFEWLKRRYALGLHEPQFDYPKNTFTLMPVCQPTSIAPNPLYGAKVFRDGKIIQLDRQGRPIG